TDNAEAFGITVDCQIGDWADGAEAKLAVTRQNLERCPDKQQMVGDARTFDPGARRIASLGEHLEPFDLIRRCCAPRQMPAQSLDQFFASALSCSTSCLPTKEAAHSTARRNSA